MIRPVPHVGAMAAYALADLGGDSTVSLAQNESAFAASPSAIAAGKAAMGDLPLYPDPEWPELRAAIADVHGLDPAQVLCGAGSMELIGCLIRAYAGPGDRVLGTDYGYAFVSSAAAQVQADYVKAREVDLTFEIRLTGVGGGVWSVRVHDGRCDVEPGFAARADVRYTAEARHWCSLALGLARGRDLFEQGLLAKEGGREAMDHYFHQVAHAPVESGSEG